METYYGRPSARTGGSSSNGTLRRGDGAFALVACTGNPGPAPPDASFDAGAVFASQTRRLIHEFRVKNSTDRVVRILSERHSCDCAKVTLERRELRPSESAALQIEVTIPPVYSNREVTCVLETDLPEHPDWVYRIKFEGFPNARIVPDRIDLGTRVAAPPTAALNGDSTTTTSAWLEVYAPRAESARARPSLGPVPPECNVDLGEGVDMEPGFPGVRVTRYPISIRLDRAGSSPGLFVRPCGVSLDGNPGASALVFWTVRAPVVCEPSFLHFGSVTPAEPAPSQRVRLRSTDGIPFRILSVNQSPLIKIEHETRPSEPSIDHSLSLRLSLPRDSSRAVSGSLLIRLDRLDSPDVLVPWSAFAR
jgi:hypothetical protein